MFRPNSDELVPFSFFYQSNPILTEELDSASIDAGASGLQKGGKQETASNDKANTTRKGIEGGDISRRKFQTTNKIIIPKRRKGEK
jgi:hypothetical protein